MFFTDDPSDHFLKLCNSSPIFGAIGGAELPKLLPKLLNEGLFDPMLGGAGAAGGGAATPGMLFLKMKIYRVVNNINLPITCDEGRLALDQGHMGEELL